MPLSAATWVAVPLVGAAIGYVTNRVAVAMIFRPVRPVRLLGLRLQGLVPRRQPELAQKIGRVVGGHLVQHADVVRALEGFDFEKLIGEVLDEALAPKVRELRQMPLVGAFLTDERVADLSGSIARGVARERELVLAKLEEALEQGLDVQAIVTEKVAAFPVEKLERLVLEVASRELRAIEVLGGVLGFLIGLGQVGLIAFLG